MVWIDYAILAIIGFSSLISLVRGFVKEAISLVIWFAAFFIASHFYEPLAVYITSVPKFTAVFPSIVSDSIIRNGMAIVALFVSTLILGSLINYLLALLVDKTGLSGTDRVLGVCFGAIRGVLIVSALLFVVGTFTSASDSEWWHQSKLIVHFKPIWSWFLDLTNKSANNLIK
jgi:membrane protein required for colicin V production